MERRREPAAIELGDGAATYVWGARRHPFVHPLRTPAGEVLTVDAPADHPWHHGMWFAVKYVNGENFWEEYGEYGVVRHDDQPARRDDPAGTTVAGTLSWIRPDRRSVVLHEERILRWSSLDEHAHALDWTVRLHPHEDVVLDRTPYTTWGGYGGLTLRGRPDWCDTRLRVDDGTVTDQLRGQHSAWCDLSGTVAGREEPVGVLILDHPGNAEDPCPWYASTRADTYGDDGWSNFCNAAFLWDGPLAVAAGGVLERRHRVIVHDGELSSQRCQREHDAWVRSTDA